MTGCPTLRLEEPTLGVLSLDPYTGYVVQSYDLGDAIIREVAVDRPGADGTIDTTAYRGARTVTLAVHILPDDVEAIGAKLDRLRSFTGQRVRPYLYVQEDGEPERRLLLRASQFSAPLTDVTHRKVVVQWRAPDGVLESALEEQASAFASGAGAEVGRTYDGRTYDGRTYPTTPIIGSVSVVNDGNTDVWPLVRIYGACTEPNIENQTTGKKLEFNSLTINAGEFLEIDTRNKTVRLNSLAASSLYDKLDFAVSAPGLDLRIVPGENLFRFYPATNGATSVAEITWRSTWL